MPRTERKTAPSIWNLCREWKIEKLRGELAMAVVPEGDEDGLARAVMLYDATLIEAEQRICRRAHGGAMQSLDDAQAVLHIALTLLRERGDHTDAEERAKSLVKATHNGLNAVRNAIEPPQARAA